MFCLSIDSKYMCVHQWFTKHTHAYIFMPNSDSLSTILYNVKSVFVTVACFPEVPFIYFSVRRRLEMGRRSPSYSPPRSRSRGYGGRGRSPERGRYNRRKEAPCGLLVRNIPKDSRFNISFYGVWYWKYYTNIHTSTHR